MNFKNNVIRKLQRDGFTVMPAKRYCGFELISTNPIGIQAGIRVKPHGHITRPERKKLLSRKMPIYIASEKYSGDPNIHEIRVVRLQK